MSESDEQARNPRLEQVVKQAIAPWKSEWLNRKTPFECTPTSYEPGQWHVRLLFRSTKAHHEAHQSGLFDQMRAAIFDAVEKANSDSPDEALRVHSVKSTSQKEINFWKRHDEKKKIYNDLVDKVSEPVEQEWRDWLKPGGGLLSYGGYEEQVIQIVFPTREKQAEAESQSIPAKIEESIMASLVKVNKTHRHKPLVILVGHANMEDVIEGGGPYNYFR